MKIKLPKLFVKPKNLLSKHINSFITHAFSNRRSSSSSSRGKSRAMGEKLFDDQKSKMICHEPTDTNYKSLSFREFLENNKDNEGRKVTIFKKKGARRITGNNNNDAFIAKECSKHSGRISSRTASGRRRSTQNAIIIIDNGEEEEEDDENENGGMELCKKRILMGVKCRPINVSGCLNYDETGILLPEEIFE